MTIPRRRNCLALIGIIAAMLPALSPAAGGSGAPTSAAAAPGPLGVTAEVTTDAYLFRVPIGDGTPDQVQVTVAGHGLQIVKTFEAGTVHEENANSPYSYRRSAQYASGTTRRRLPLPADADPARMTRTVSDGSVLVRIPRGGAPGRDRSKPPPTGHP